MLRAYIDDSRHDQEAGIASGVYALAGYVGYAADWERFSDEWDMALRQGPRSLEYLKTAQAYRLDDPRSMFFGWSAKDRDEKLLLLAKTVNRFAYCSVLIGRAATDCCSLFSRHGASASGTAADYPQFPAA